MTTDDPAFTEHLGSAPPPLERSRGGPPPSGPPPRRAALPRGPLLVGLAGALGGAFFSGLSTGDFMQHLDRQVHAIHCSLLPGAAGEMASGCRTVMMSPYSSVLREHLWGGVPVSLAALAVFAFLAYRAALPLWRGHLAPGETKVLMAAAALPVATSIGFGAISFTVLDAVCKVCIGIYAASAACLAGAVLAHRAAGPAVAAGRARLVPALLEGTGLVAALTVAYVVLAPAPEARASTLGCGSLVQAEDTAGVMIPLTGGTGGTAAIEVLDPLCASCKAFDARLAASALGERLALRGVLFPLDPACNWMVTEAVHPGACAVSEAVLCAAGLGAAPRSAAAAGAVLRWAFDRQDELRAMGARDPAALRSELERAFPELRGCLGSALVRSKLTKSLRWAVANAIPVLTPQLFVAGARMCDEDTDLGLEYTLTRMLSPEAERARALRREVSPPRPAPASEAVLQAAAVTPPAPPPAGAREQAGATLLPPAAPPEDRRDAIEPPASPAPVAAPAEAPGDDPEVEPWPDEPAAQDAAPTAPGEELER